MQRLLFICSRNKLRSPTAEKIFSEVPGVDVDSAGLAPDAECPLSTDQVEWAEIIFVMEKAHRSKLTRHFKRALSGKRVVCLDIPDNYQFMQPELVALLKRKVPQYLR